MTYTRKTKDIYILMANYGYGWDELLHEDTKKEAFQQLKTYISNQSGSYKIIKKRIKL